MRICVITAGHLATCPRMAKAAKAFVEAGHAVRIVSTQFLDWAAEADHALDHCSWSTVDYRRTALATFWRTRIAFHAARQSVRVLGVERAPLTLLACANVRAYRALRNLALREPADLFYGGTCGGFPIAAIAAARGGSAYAVDLEDFHEGESQSPMDRAIVRRIQHEVLPGAAFVTAGSEAIAVRYEREYAVSVSPIHNTFPLPARVPDLEPSSDGALRLYWFGQTIGADRGIEDVVRAIGLSGIHAELHLRGMGRPDYQIPDRLTLRVYPPAPPDQMVDLARPYDVGISAETAKSLNRELCLSNKALTYPLAGLAVVLTDTAGQRPLARDLGEGAVCYRSGDIAALAQGLRNWAEHRGQLRRARQAAWQAAQRRWHWEHSCEKGALLAALAPSTRSVLTGAAR